MKKIGTTSSGSVIIEMTVEQFDALIQFQTSGTGNTDPEVKKMSGAEKAAFVRERIMKLMPKKKDGVIRSISAMFQFTGGITEQEVNNIIHRLQKEKLFVIDEGGRVKYEKI